MDRRTFLGGVAVSAFPVVAASLTPRERLDAAVAELKSAAAAAFPDIEHWRICIDEQKECPLLVASFKR